MVTQFSYIACDPKLTNVTGSNRAVNQGVYLACREHFV
jgi:hypothetical protein